MIGVNLRAPHPQSKCHSAQYDCTLLVRVQLEDVAYLVAELSALSKDGITHHALGTRYRVVHGDVIVEY